jgi:hypothetical protein
MPTIYILEKVNSYLLNILRLLLLILILQEEDFMYQFQMTEIRISDTSILLLGMSKKIKKID